MKKIKRVFSLVLAFISVALATLLAACAKESTISKTVRSDDGEFNPLWLILVVAVVVIAVLIVLKVLSSKKKKIAEEEAENNAEVLTQDPNAVSEYFFDDEKTVSEENTEEKTEENTENNTEENTEEKSTDEETSTSEITESEDETTEVKSATEEETEETTELKTVTEPEEIVEEVADATFANETEEKSEITTEKIEENEDFETDETEETFEEVPEYTIGANGLPVAPEGKVIRYKWSFLGRLILADDELKYRYMMLRRKLLSYKKVRSNVSWNFDSYFIGRKPIVKLKVRGKTLVAYFPLDPAEMSGTKYVGEDVSAVSRYKAVPFAYRINGMRKLKYAIELIEKQLEGIKSTDPEYIEISQVNEAIPRESLKKLYEKGYVRVGGILAVGERASAQDDEEEDEDIQVTETEIEEEIAPSKLREEFNFNPKAAQ